MRAAIVVTIAFVLAACSSSNNLGSVADGGADDTMTSDSTDGSSGDGGGADSGLRCITGEGICYASDCITIASCSDIGSCPGGQLYPNQCYGPDASRDGAGDR